MSRISGDFPAAGDKFWSGLADNKPSLPAEPKAPPGWQVITALAIYVSLAGLIGVMLAG